MSTGGFMKEPNHGLSFMRWIMMKNEEKIFKIDSLDLKLDIVLVDFIYPVLFTCVDDYDNMYIVSCYLADSKTKEWLIAETSPEKVISLLQNETTIRDLFFNTNLWQAILKAENTVPSIRHVKADELDSHIFPTEGEFMDADPDEFTTEIQQLSKRINNIYSKVKSQEKHLFFWRTYSFSMENATFQKFPPIRYGAERITREVICDVPA